MFGREVHTSELVQAADKSRLRLPRRWCVLRRPPFFKGGPPLGVPRVERARVALGGLGLGQLGTLAEGPDDAADMGRMVRHAEELLDERGDALGRPGVTDKAECRCPFGQRSPQLLALLIMQARRGTGGGASAQTGDATVGAAFNLLANRARRHA